MFEDESKDNRNQKSPKKQTKLSETMKKMELNSLNKTHNIHSKINPDFDIRVKVSISPSNSQSSI